MKSSRADEGRGFVNTHHLVFSHLFSGIINSTGKLWKDQRRFLHEKLRQFGMTYMGNGKHIMEKRIMVNT